MGTIFQNAFRKQRGAILGWGLSLAVLGGYLMLFYETLTAQREQLQQLISSYPEELMAFFGGIDDIFTPAGFLHVEFFSYMPLILGIFAVLAGSGMLVADEEGGILDLLMAHPISRTALFLGRWLAFTAATTTILTLAYIGLLVGAANATIDLGWVDLLRPFLSLLAVLLLFGSMALFLSLVLPSRRLAAMAGGILLVASFFISSLVRIDDRLETLNRFSPLKYYQGGEAIPDLNLEWFGGLLAFALLFTFLAWWRYGRRDIRVGGEGGWRLQIPFLETSKPAH